MASWGCPHEIDGKCTKINHLTCDPGMKGCVLAGRYFFTGHQAAAFGGTTCHVDFAIQPKGASLRDLMVVEEIE